MSETYTITFGDVAENHVGNQQIGDMAVNGFSISESTGKEHVFIQITYDNQ